MAKQINDGPVMVRFTDGSGDRLAWVYTDNHGVKRIDVLEIVYQDLDQLLEGGATVTPMVVMTPERIAALRLYTSTFGNPDPNGWPELTEAHNALRAILDELEATNA